MKASDMMTLEELKDRIVLQLDETTLLDLLDMNIETMVEDFEEHIQDNWDKIVAALYE